MTTVFLLQTGIFGSFLGLGLEALFGPKTAVSYRFSHQQAVFEGGFDAGFPDLMTHP